jgi:hypothetical protein
MRKRVVRASRMSKFYAAIINSGKSVASNLRRVNM